MTSEQKTDQMNTKCELGRMSLSSLLLLSIMPDNQFNYTIIITMQAQSQPQVEVQPKLPINPCPNPTILIEHMQQYLYEWCMYEYAQMKQYVMGTSCNLVITNAKSIFNYDGPHAQENKKNLGELIRIFQSAGEGKCRLVNESVVELVELGKLNKPVCMLDMRAHKELSTEQNWSTLIFGGILGDHPPRDRPAPVRKYFQNIRHLGDLQLATDTAVLITRLIIQNKVPLSKIPLIREPTIKGVNSKGQKTTVQMQGFSYVSKQMDIKTGKLAENMDKKQKKQIYISEGVHRLLIQEDLSAQQLM